MPHSFQLAVSSDRVIRGSLFPAKEDSAGTLIICHGYKGFKDWGMFPYVGEQLSERLDVITFNFSHNGVGEQLEDFDELEKFARNTYSRELEDLDTLAAAIKERSLPCEPQPAADPLFLLGHSRGAGVCLIYAFDHPERVKGIISWNGIANVDLFSPEVKAEMRANGRSYVDNARTGQRMPLDVEILHDIERNAERFNIIARAPEAKVPIALIQGSNDGERLRKGSEKLLSVNPHISYTVIPGGSHTFGAVHPFRGTTEALELALEKSGEVLLQWSQAYANK